MNPRLFLLLIVLAVRTAAAQSTLYTVENNGPRSQRINIVFLSEGYTAADMPNFAGHVNTVMNYLFSREPWQQYRSFCNVFRIEIASSQAGCDNGAAGGLRNTYFGTGFTTPSVPQLITFDGTGQSRAYTLLNQHVPEYDMPIVLVNDVNYGGSGGPISIVSINSLSAQILEHEVGHSFANLADEYDTDYPSYTPSEKPNNTAQTVRSLIKWNVWIDPATPVATPETSAYDSLVGLFEGSMYRTTGWYRPHNNSLMRNLNCPVGNVNREQFVVSIYNRVDPVDAWSPAGTNFSVNGSQNLSFAVTPKQPTTGVVQTRWFIDGVLLAAAKGNDFRVISDVIGNGTHTVRAQVNDLTSFVRSDPGLLLSQEVTWTVTLSNQVPPKPRDVWWLAHLGTTTFTGNAAANADPEGDSMQNLEEWAFGLDPGVPDRRAIVVNGGAITRRGTPLATVETTESGTAYRALFGRRKDYLAAGLIYKVQFSADLTTWENSTTTPTVVASDSEMDATTVPYPFLLSTGAKAQFFRVLVTSP